MTDVADEVLSELLRRADEEIETFAIGGDDDSPVINRAGLLGGLRDILDEARAEARDLLSGKRAVIPQTREHAEALYAVALGCLKSYGVTTDRRTDTAVVGKETEQQIEDRLMMEEAADNLRLIDWIADKISLPKEEELSRDNFAAWLRSPTGREAGLEEAAKVCDALAAEQRSAAGHEGVIDKEIWRGRMGNANGATLAAAAIRALLPSEQKARS